MGMGIYVITGENGNVFIYYYGNGIGMGIRSWKREGMGLKKSFPHISTRKTILLAAVLH